MALILIAEDSPTEVYLLKTMLEKHQYTVMVAADGEQAVSLAQSKQPDLILMDVVMPKLNGFQATRRLSRAADTAHIPIIIISSKNQEADRLWGHRQGAQGYLSKPLDEHKLIETLHSFLGNT